MKLYTSLSLECLADKMIQDICSNWKDPFNSPVIIFSDSKMQQWFKMFWLRHCDPQKQVMMNLNCQRLESFLFKLIETSSYRNGKTDNEKKLNNKCEFLDSFLLRDIISSKLTSKTDDGKYWFYTLNDNDVNAYLTDKSDNENEKYVLNTVRLYDFSCQMASLFTEYETSRNPDFITGWQKKLYDEVTGNGAIIEGKLYRTFAEMIYNNKDNNEGKLNLDCSNIKSVYLFGFSGMGQIYRETLKAVDEKCTLTVYQQTISLKKNTESFFEKKWAEYGKENLKLWDIEAEHIPYFSENKSSETLLYSVKKNIENGTDKITWTDDDSITVTAATDKVREMEILHSKICTLIQNKSVQLNDILVVAPDIDAYKVAIRQVFDQNDIDDKEFPYIPYSIANFSSRLSMSAQVLSSLLGIAEKGYISRTDFFNVVRNSVVRSARGISENDVSVWSEWACSLNIFRDRGNEDNKDVRNDWEKAKERLLLSKLTENVVNINGTEILPFSNMESEDDNCLFRFVETVDDIEEWKNFTSADKYNKEMLDKFLQLLEKWFIRNNDNESMYSEHYVFESIKEEVIRQKSLLCNGEYINRAILVQSLNGAAENLSMGSGSVFSRGVTFTSFKANSIMSADYIFFIGLDSISFPGKEEKNVLDLRRGNELPGDDNVPLKNRNGFMCQLLSANKEFHISYVCMNLKKDEELFCSSVVKELLKGCGVDDKKIIHISIDEKRLWKELFTRREFRNKGNFTALENGNNISQKKTKIENFENENSVPERISISQLKNFLDEPFKFKCSRIFAESDDSSDFETIEYEPLDFDFFTARDYSKNYAIEKISSSGWDEKNFAKSLERKNLLPDSFFGTKAIENVINQGDLIIDILTRIYGTREISFNDNTNLQLSFKTKEVCSDSCNKDYSVTSNAEKVYSWNLTGKLCWHSVDFVETKNLFISDFNSKENYISCYLTALALIAGSPELEDDVEINIFTSAIALNAGSFTEINFSLSKKESISYLNKIFETAFVQKFGTCMPVDLFVKKLDEKDFSLNDLAFELTGKFNQNYWQYFDQAAFFDPFKDIGYTPSDFADQWNSAGRKITSLIKYLDEKVKEFDEKKIEELSANNDSELNSDN